MPDTMLEGSLKRTLAFTEALEDVDRAAERLLAAAQAVQPLEIATEHVGVDLHALHALTMSARAALIEQARAAAAQHGWQVATYLIAEDVHAGEPTEPIFWLTSNRMMPPLREYANSESIWQASNAYVWEAYVEALEARCEQLDISLASPEYDNSLYAVDLRRWEWADNEDGESMRDDWKLREDAQ